MEEFISVAEAAAFRGVSPQTIRNWTRQGRLRQHPGDRGWTISRAELREVTRADALAVLAGHGSQEKLAAKVRDLLFPVSRAEARVAGGMIDFKNVRSTSGTVAAQQLADYRNGALVADAVTVFGTAVLHAACAPLKVGGGGGCRWCLADVLAVAEGAPPPVDMPAWQTLLGPKCLGCVLNFTPPKPARTARTAPGGRSPGRTAGGGASSPNHYLSESQRALGLADAARAKDDHAGSRRLRRIAAEFARKAGS